jgi:hypothetical protein
MDEAATALRRDHAGRIAAAYAAEPNVGAVLLADRPRAATPTASRISNRRKLVSRIRAAYVAESADAEELLRQVIEETYDIVEQRLPAVDVARLREIFRYRRPLWD